MHSDELTFAAEAADGEQTRGHGADPWRVLVVDDDPDVFRLTELSLTTMRFRDRGVQVLTASSGTAARVQLDLEPGIALALIDVVMETETAVRDGLPSGREGPMPYCDELGGNSLRPRLRGMIVAID